MLQLRPAHPRSPERGLIEAISSLRVTGRAIGHPRSPERGLIEAGVASGDADIALAIRAHPSAASLKHYGAVHTPRRYVAIPNTPDMMGDAGSTRRIQRTDRFLA